MTPRATPDYDVSIEFLRSWNPAGPWALVGIPVERGAGAPVGAVFRPDQWPEAKAWLEANGVDRNIYFHVNDTGTFSGDKAKKGDIVAVRALQADIDPEKPKTSGSTDERRAFVVEEQTRIREMVTGDLPGDLPPPSAVIFSGGGYQLFWILREPIPPIPAVEDHNRGIAALVGGDSVHNIDRIMRLPGALNRPDKHKRNRGRVILRAELVEFHGDRRYTLEDFPKGEPKKKPKAKAKPAAPVKDDDLAAVGGARSGADITFDLPEDPPRITELDLLPSTVHDFVKVVINQGCDPDNPDRWQSRSEPLHFVCCALWRAGLTAAEIFGIITDAQWPISESVLDKGNRIRDYAHKQLVSSWEATRDEDLSRMNSQFAVIRNFGGKCRIIEEVEDPGANDRPRLTKLSFTDFAQGFCNQRKQIGVDKNGNPKRIPMGKWWIDHPHRRQFDTIGFYPGKDTPGVYNMWRGFAYQPNPGGSCALFDAHVLDNICGGNREHYEYLRNWMAYAVQYPDRQGEIAIVLRGKQGTGKGIFAGTFGKLFGRHYLQISNAKHLTGAFNAHLRDTSILFADEAFYAGDKQHEGTLKAIITEPLVTIEAKGVDAEAAQNYLHVIMASNEKWVIPANVHDRRFFVLDVNEAQMQRTEYFGPIIAELEAGGYGKLLHDFQTVDLSDFNVRDFPRTEVLRDQKQRSFSPEEAWWFEKLQCGKLFEEHDGWTTEVEVTALRWDFISYCERRRVAPRVTQLGRIIPDFLPPDFLHKGLPIRRISTTPAMVRENSGEFKTCNRPSFYSLPGLDICREFWDNTFSGPYRWENEPELMEVSGVKDDEPF